MDTQQPIIQKIGNNQVTAIGQSPIQYNFRIRPHFIICPQCGYKGDSFVRGECNVYEGCCFFCCGSCYLLYTILNLKDITFVDAYHSCPKCNAPLGVYKTCE
jgi:hypothetical protein